MNYKIKKILILLLTTIILLLAYGSFFKFHLVSDTYRIVNNNPEYIITLKCNEGRLIQVLYFTILNILNISINSINTYMFLYRVNLVISIILLTISVLFTFKMLSSYIKNISVHKKIIIYLCTLLIFINASISEYLLFFENFIMIVGVLLSIIAAYIYHTDIKYKNISIFALILMSSFCHQGVAQIFVILSTLILLISKSNQQQKYYLKEIFKILVLYFIPLMINYLICWWLNSILPNLDPRIFTGILESLKQLVSLDNMLIMSLYVVIFQVLILFNIKTLIGKNLFGFIYLLITSIISFEIFVFNNLAGIFPRILLNFIIIYPILKIYIVNLKEKNKYIIDILILIIFLVINLLTIINLQWLNINSTTKNIETVQAIIEKVNKYETENNVKIKNVAFYNDKILNYTYWNANVTFYFSYSAPIYYGYWCDIYSMNVLSGTKYTRIPDSSVDKKMQYYFITKNWDEFNVDEQVICEKDTVHICRF